MSDSLKYLYYDYHPDGSDHLSTVQGSIACRCGGCNSEWEEEPRSFQSERGRVFMAYQNTGEA